MRLCLVEDMAASGLEPLTLTRPVHELLLGATSLGSKLAQGVRGGPGTAEAELHLIRSHLAAVHRSRDPHAVVNDRDWLARAGDRGEQPVGAAGRLPRSPDEPGAWVGLCDGQPACALVGPEDAVSLEPQGVDAWFDRVAARHGGVDVGGEWIARPWDLVARNGAYLERDFARVGRVRRCRTDI